MATQHQPTIKDLLEAGAHFGHQTHRWNPKMKRYVFESRNGLHIIDLAKTLQLLREAVSVVTEIVGQGKSVLFVGTKKQAKGATREIAEACGEYYVVERWLGGMLTNFKTIQESSRKLEQIEKRISSGGEGLTKKELVNLTKDQIKLDRNLSGIRGMRRIPGLVIIVDPSKEHLAVAEARTLRIPIMALVDTNCDPDQIDHVIPCNDDALKSVRLILQTLAQAIIDTKNEKNIGIQKGDEDESSAEERELLAAFESTEESKEEV